MSAIDPAYTLSPDYYRIVYIGSGRRAMSEYPLIVLIDDTKSPISPGRDFDETVKVSEC